MKEKRNLTQIIKDVGVGIGYTAVGCGFAVLAYNLVSETIKSIDEIIPLYHANKSMTLMACGLFSFSFACAATMSTVRGIGKIFGYNIFKKEKNEEKYNSLDEDVNEINRNYTGFEHKKIKLLNNLPADYQDLE